MKTYCLSAGAHELVFTFVSQHNLLDLCLNPLVDVDVFSRGEVWRVRSEKPLDSSWCRISKSKQTCFEIPSPRIQPYQYNQGSSLNKLDSNGRVIHQSM